MNVKNILVPVDFSVCSFLLAEEVASLAKALGSDVTFLHVMEVPAGLQADTKIHVDGQEESVNLVDYLTKEAKGYQQSYLTHTRAQGVEASFALKHGSIVESILGTAEELNADMIVMGTHGRQGFSRLMLGSVAESVLRQATIPVMTLRSLHKPTCDAMSCATCTSGFTSAERQASAELSG
ncbi:MAG: universal stress protein [Deltaproteobacteria bacterium]|nr:MAG: universal stress protein [Deltaproteobacteria bacterium]